MGLIHDWRGMVVGMAIQQTGAGMAVPCLVAWAQNHLPFAHRGRGMGIWTSCFFFGQFSSPMLVSLLRVATGHMQGAFVVAGIFGAITVGPRLFFIQAVPAIVAIAVTLLGH